MKTKLNLAEIYPSLSIPGANPILEIYNQYKSTEYDTHNKRPCIIICPGGYYQYTSDREAEPIALKFLSEGYNVFILRYSVLPVQYPQQLLELAAAVAHVRVNATQYYIDPKNISIAGFSAGGHLCASLATLFGRKFISDTLKIKSTDCYPNKLLLGYAVIDIKPHTPPKFVVEDIDITPSRQEYYTTAISDYVSAATPPTFIWHTISDKVVPVENAFMFADALRKNSIPFELHIYPFGTHGLSLANDQSATNEKHLNEHVASWVNLALEWLKISYN
ncbi:alpha/beta hydrolase [Candidatus Epulonipiscium viviparus]|uniref:alpha/beta hydrolase n=1 Tax=Candidatus Epulonipiscium viviparus TaxID=420336 RepID=UPI00016BFF2B|nr:alpha/beta hydrolase [Candidatus Epulopiscium viviparus]